MKIVIPYMRWIFQVFLPDGTDAEKMLSEMSVSSMALLDSAVSVFAKKKISLTPLNRFIYNFNHDIKNSGEISI